jgi:hypothetical protein
LPGYADGVYPVEAMNVYEPMPEPMRHYPAPSIPAPEGSQESTAALETVNAVLATTDRALSPATDAVLSQQFTRVITYKHFAVYVRK